MKPLQQDDVYDLLNKPKRKFKYLDNVSNKTVRAENKKEAIELFKTTYNIIVTKKNITNY